MCTLVSPSVLCICFAARAHCLHVEASERTYHDVVYDLLYTYVFPTSSSWLAAPERILYVRYDAGTMMPVREEGTVSATSTSVTPQHPCTQPSRSPLCGFNVFRLRDASVKSHYLFTCMYRMAMRSSCINAAYCINVYGEGWAGSTKADVQHGVSAGKLLSLFLCWSGDGGVFVPV